MNHRVSHRLLPLSLMLAHIRSDDEKQPDLSVRGSANPERPAAAKRGAPQDSGAVLTLSGRQRAVVPVKSAASGSQESHVLVLIDPNIGIGDCPGGPCNSVQLRELATRSWICRCNGRAG